MQVPDILARYNKILAMLHPANSTSDTMKDPVPQVLRVYGDSPAFQIKNHFHSLNTLNILKDLSIHHVLLSQEITSIRNSRPRQ
jgi:hypothetical protein